MDEIEEKEKIGNVYCVSEAEVSLKIEKVTISNGMAWSPDNKQSFFTDSPTRVIISYLYDTSLGKIPGNGKVLVVSFIE